MKPVLLLTLLLMSCLHLTARGAPVQTPSIDAVLTIAQDEAFNQAPSYAEMKKFVVESLAAHGIQLNFVSLPLERANILSSHGKIDGQLARVPDVQKQYPTLRSTKFPYVFVDIKVIYLKSRSDFDEMQLSKYRGVGILNSHLVSTAAKDSNLKIIQVKDLVQLLTMLEKKHVDYGLIPEPAIREVINRDSKLKEKLQIGPVFVRYPLHFILNEKKADLLPQVENALREALKKNRAQYPLIQNQLNANP